MLAWKVIKLQGGRVGRRVATQQSWCPRMVAFNVSSLTRTLKVRLLWKGRWGNAEKTKGTQQDWTTDNTFSSRTPNRVVKWKFNTGLQLRDLRSCPSSALIPYDLGWLRLVGANFSICKVGVKPFFSSSQGYDEDKEGHIYERDCSALREDLAFTRNRTWTSEVDEAQRMYHFNPLQCNYRRP